MSAVSKVKSLSKALLKFRSKINSIRTRDYSTGDGGIIVPVSEVTSFIKRCMTTVGTRPAHAKALADNLTAADHRGHFSHGLNRLGILDFLHLTHYCNNVANEWYVQVGTCRYRNSDITKTEGSEALALPLC